MERQQKMAEEKKAEDDLKEAISKEADLRKQLDKATEDLKKAEQNLAKRLDDVKIEKLGWKGGGRGWGTGSTGLEAPVSEGQIIGNGINGRNRYGARNNQSIRDAAYNARVQAGYERNARSQGYGLSAS